MPKEDQERVFARIRKDCETDDVEEIHKIFESMYGYRSVSPMAESVQNYALKGKGET